MNDSQTKPDILTGQTLLSYIQNSVGSKTYRNFYLKIDGKAVDVAEDGELSCAFFVSNMLSAFNLINKGHGTVDSTQKDIEESGWTKIDHPKPGCVIIWGPDSQDPENHKHIGFYVGDNQAISNSSAKRVISKHDWRFDNTREVIGIFCNPTIDATI